MKRIILSTLLSCSIVLSLAAYVVAKADPAYQVPRTVIELPEMVISAEDC